MDRIARLMQECVIKGKSVLNEVKTFRETYQTVHFSYDTARIQRSRE